MVVAESPSASSHIGHARLSTIRSSIRTSYSRCTQCNPRPKENSKNPRNLVVCIDGTSNQFGQNNTNVVKLFAKIDLESTYPAQHAYYSSGIGTRPKTLHILQRMERAVTDKFDMAVAWNMEEIVKDAYGWLARTYQEGDQIYLFGFSRGAYQVRVLAGMIHEIGLIRTPTDKQIGTAYDHFEAIRSGKPKTRQIAREFKNTFSWKGLRVHFVGVWDTVSSVGLIRGDVFLSTSSSAAHACHFRHALALDELRVKFIPEYFHEMNSQTDDVRSKYVNASLDGECTAASPSDRRESTVSDNGTGCSGIEKLSNPDIKEVWFAGTHSDVGGRNRPGRSHQAGNASLLWMRREAAERGLVLLPTDIVWVPDDLDLGTSDSMSAVWRVIEYLPIKHQVSFSGAGEDARRVHKLQPRRIIPGQKVHASILYANAYKPQATLGEGFDIPITHAEYEDTDLGGQIWETGLFDDTAAQELVNSLDGQQGVAPIYLDRLLFMLRFKEGKQCVRNVPHWQGKLENLIRNSECAPLVRLVTIVAYYEASCDPEAQGKSPALPREKPSKDAFDVAKKCLSDILAKHKHRDGPRVVALLRPLTKHQDLRVHILTQDVLDALVHLLDEIVTQQDGNFGQAMDGLNSLLQCEHTREVIVAQLGAPFPGSNASRLSRILKVNNSRLLVAALRMVLTLAHIHIPEARTVCTAVKPRIKDLAAKRERLVGLLAVEIWLALYDESDPVQLNIRDSHVRANLASALVRMNFDTQGPAEEQTRDIDPGQHILRSVFGLDETELNERQRRLIRELKTAVRTGNARERTAATMTLLKLCETTIIRQYLHEIGLLDVFINQMQRKDAALLAAYALATCLKYSDMKDSMKQDVLLPKYIVGMLRQDYFDDAVGQVEGFQIFGNIMRDDDLRKNIKEYRITEVLEEKLANGKPKEIRTSLICLDIIRSFEQDASGAKELVGKSLTRLKNPAWKVQKAGVAILSALAQTEHGVAAIGPRIAEIIEILLPEEYLPIPRIAQGAVQTNPTSTSEVQADPVPVANEPLAASADMLSRPPSWMMGPTCALRILAQNQELRGLARGSMQYASLKHLYLSGTLVGERDTSPWRIKTPNRTDVTGMLDKMIKSIDGELSEEGLMSIGDTALPHIQHWNRLVTLLRNHAVGWVTILPGFFGVSALAIVVAAVAAPIYLSVQAYGFFQKLLSRYQNTRILDGLRGGHDALASLVTQGGHADPGVHQSEAGSSGHHEDEGPLAAHHSVSPQDVEAVGPSLDAESSTTTRQK